MFFKLTLVVRVGVVFIISGVVVVGAAAAAAAAAALSFVLTLLSSGGASTPIVAADGYGSAPLRFTSRTGDLVVRACGGLALVYVSRSVVVRNPLS